MNMWVVSEGRFWNDITSPIGVFSTKEKAMKFCRKQGFKYSRTEKNFYKNEIKMYRNIEGPFKLDEE